MRLLLVLFLGLFLIGCKTTPDAIGYADRLVLIDRLDYTHEEVDELNHELYEADKYADEEIEKYLNR